MNARASQIAIAIGACVAALAIVACEQIAGLDVTYRAHADGGAESDGASDEGSIGAVCPCDQSAGLGCCVTSAQALPYCAPTNACGTTTEPALFIGCQRPNTLDESTCCWTATDDAGTTFAASYASDCNGRAESCLVDDDCNGEKCNLTACRGMTLGVCGDKPAPACPAGP